MEQDLKEAMDEIGNEFADSVSASNDGDIVIEDEDITEMRIEETMAGFESLCDKLNRLDAVTRDMAVGDGICKMDAIALEAIDPNMLDLDRYPVDSFTIGRTKTNLDVAMEAITVTKDHVKGGVIAAAVLVVAKIIHWLYKKIASLFGKVEASKEVAAAAKATAKSADKAVDAISSGGSKRISPDAEDEPKVSTTQLKKVIEAPRLIQQDIKNMTCKQVSTVLEARRGEHFVRAFQTRNTELIADMLANPKEYIGEMGKFYDAINKRINWHIDQFDFYNKVLQRAKYDAGDSALYAQANADTKEAKEKVGFSRAAITVRQAFGKGYQPASDGMNVAKAIFKMADMDLSPGKYTFDERLYVALQNIRDNKAGKPVERFSPEYKNIQDALELIERTNFDGSDLVDRMGELQKKVDLHKQHGGPGSSVHSPIESDTMTEWFDGYRGDIAATNYMARFYVMMLAEIGRITEASIQANGWYGDDVRTALTLMVKHKEEFGSSTAKKLERAADDMGERLNGFREKIDEWKSRREKFLTAAERSASQLNVDNIIVDD